MKLVPFGEYTISPDVALPLPMQFAINDSEVFKSSFPRIVVECPQGIAPYRWMNIRYVFYGWFPYSFYRKDEFVFREIERDGKPYMRYVFNIPRTKASRTLRSYFYPTWLVLRTERPSGKAPPVYLHAEWEGGRQEPAAIDIEVVSFDHEGFRFEHIPAGLWADPFYPDIRNYCRKLGINYVVTNMPEGDKEGYSGMLAEARARLSPDIGLDYYSRKIWWRKRLPKWAEEIAFTRIDGSVDTRFPCLSYRGPMWYEDRERAKQLILKGFDGVTTDIECDVYRGCFHEMTLARFRKYLAEHHPKLEHMDPRVFEKKPDDHSELHGVWVQFQGRLMSEYYAMLADGIREGAKELGLAKPPRLTIYNDERYGRKSADLTHLFAEPPPGMRLLLAPPNYRSHWLAGNEVRASVKKFPNACPCPHIGRPGSGVTDEEAFVYEVFANGARGFVMFAWTWNDGREVHQFARGLANIRKIEEFIARSRILDEPFDQSESVRIRAVGNGDEKFVFVAQYPSSKWVFCPTVSFTIPTRGRARVVDLRTDEQLARIAPGTNTIAIEFADFGVFPLHVQPLR